MVPFFDCMFLSTPEGCLKNVSLSKFVLLNISPVYCLTALNKIILTLATCFGLCSTNFGAVRNRQNWQVNHIHRTHSEHARSRWSTKNLIIHQPPVLSVPGNISAKTPIRHTFRGAGLLCT